jgi:hypothetical protein
MPEPDTLPDPVPARATDRLCDGGGGLLVKVAVTDWSKLIVTVHVPVPLHPPPDQPAKLEPELGEALNVTIVPAG